MVDAAIYYGNKPERFNDTFCEIEFPQQHLYLYDEIRENERIKLYNLKGYCKYDKNNFSFYDHLTQKNLTHYLYLQIQKTSRCQIFSAIKSLKEEAVRVKEFAKVNLPSTTLLSSLSHDSDDSITEYNKLVQVKNEIDILGVILEVDHQKALGVMSNGHLFKVTVSLKFSIDF